MNNWVGVALGAAGIVSLILVVKLYFMLRSLAASFAKLGYVIREDAKKYFDDAAGKIVDTNKQFQTSYTQIVHDGTVSALTEAEAVLESALQTAQQEASAIILKAREDAQNIVAAAKNNTVKQSDDAMGRSADTIRWVMEQYLERNFSIEEHEQIIAQLMDEYIYGQHL